METVRTVQGPGASCCRCPLALKDEEVWEFPGGPVVKTPCFHCRGRGFIPGPGTNIPHASQCIPQIKNKLINKIKDEGVQRLWDVEGDSHGAQAVLTREVTFC